MFGSVRRGEARPDSDIDLLVSMEKGKTQLDFIGLWQDLEELLGCKVDVIPPSESTRICESEF